EGAAGFGYWWDAVLVQWTNTPTVGEMQTTLGSVEQQFRTFQLPTNIATDPIEYAHEQIEFSKDNTLIICSNKIGHLVRQALSLSLISNTENPWVGWARYATSSYLNTIT